MSRLLGLLVSCALAGCAGAPSPRQAAPPIPWEGWSAAAFARAKAERKPILVHVIAGWCHWCHVMDEETYGDPEVARLIAARFVPIKVDSDARPDLGERYRRWGWPAVALLAPDATTILHRRGYQPKERFLGLLRRVLEDHEAGRPYRDAAELPPAAVAGPPVAADLTRTLALTAEQLDAAYDPVAQGWGRGDQRYPLHEPIEHAFLRARRRGEATWRERGLLTLREMEGLIDPAFGGIYQYSDDGTWRSPHYEKIPQVQAGVLEVLVLAWLETGDARWLAQARGVERYLKDHLLAPGGAFRASQDADPPRSAGVSAREYFALDREARLALGQPRIDPAIYAEVNGLLARSLAVLGGAAGDAATVALAAGALERLLATHRVEGGFTHRPAAEEGPEPLLHLADQVAVGRAALALHAATGEARWLELARELAQGLSRLRDPQGGGFFASTPDPAGVLAPRKPFQENAMAGRFLLELGALLEEEAWRPEAEGALRSQADPALVKSWGRDVGHYLFALEALAVPSLVIELIVPPGQERSEAARALHAAALRAQRAGRLVRVRPPHDDEPVERPVLRACGPSACSPLLADPAELPQVLRDIEGAAD